MQKVENNNGEVGSSSADTFVKMLEEARQRKQAIRAKAAEVKAQ